MKKNIVSLFLCVIILLASFTCVYADLKFSDVPDTHWASKDVYTLVKEGIINGYEDGTFRPDAKVNRAEFAKLVGADDEANTTPFSDVPENYWGYKYIMASNIDSGDAKFYPEEYMKRGDICEILYLRHGNGTKIKVPALITQGSYDEDAVAWAYSTGLMIGDDGINLRLSDSVTRAETVTLIQRAKSIDNSAVKTIYDLADKKTLAYIFNGVDIFNEEYNEDTQFTHGELAQAAMRLAYTHQPPAEVYTKAPGFEHEYADDLAVICDKIWGMDKCNENFCNEKANMQETLSALMFGYMVKSEGQSVKLSVNDLYSDFADNGTSMQKMFISTAKSSGIVINGDAMDAKRIADFEDVAILLLQINNITGLEYMYNGDHSDVKINDDITGVSNKILDRFAVLVDSVPVWAYEADMNSKDTCKEATRFIRSYKSVFTYVLDNLENTAANNGHKIDITFYPTMVAHSTKGYVARIRIIASNDVMLNKIFPNTDIDKLLEAGEIYFIDIDTCADIADMLSEIPNIKVLQVI